MSQQINTIVDSVLREQGLSSTPQATRAAEALKTRLGEAASRAATTIRGAARVEGIDEEQVNAVLVDAGLVDRPTPAPVAASSSGTSDVGALQRTVDRLVEFARRHGFTG